MSEGNSDTSFRKDNPGCGRAALGIVVCLLILGVYTYALINLGQNNIFTGLLGVLGIVAIYGIIRFFGMGLQALAVFFTQSREKQQRSAEEEQRQKAQQAGASQQAQERQKAERAESPEKTSSAEQKGSQEDLLKGEARTKVLAVLDSIAREQAERAAREKAEAERIAREKSEAFRFARQQDEAREKAEVERVARELEGAKRLDEAERVARERAERLAREKAEAERIAREMAAQAETVRARRQLGNYRVVRLLGRGGFAEVYLGEHIYLQTQAAIKVLATQLAPEDVDHFQSEARTIARLRHAHIVRVLEFGIDSSTPFLVMDYAPGGSLRQRYPKGTRLPLPTIVSYVRQTPDALQYAHDHKFIHRDVKPENMLLGDDQEVLLSDFGIAVVVQSSRYDRTMDTTGTIAYMAPEQIQAHPRPASDQYALGVVVYEWLCGDRPFSGSFTEVAAKHVLTPPPPLHEKLPTLSPIVEQVVMTALEKDPQRRFATVSAFARALEQASHIEP